MPEAALARPSLRSAVGAGLGLGFAFVYPIATEHALLAWGARAAGALVLGVGLLSLLLLGRGRAQPGLGTLARVGLLALPALAVATGAPIFLRLVPAALQATLAAFFLATLRTGGSLFEDAARIVQPHAPDFIRPYCRKATVVFAVLFGVQALTLVALVVRAPAQGWGSTASALIWAPLLALLAGEWMLRKAWFRHYGRNPLDRILRVLLPPERTARGRRSLAYIERMHQQLGIPPP